MQPCKGKLQVIHPGNDFSLEDGKIPVNKMNADLKSWQVASNTPIHENAFRKNAEE